MNLFEFYEQDSFLHRVNPTVKLAAIFIMLLAVVLAFDPLTPLIFLLLAVALLTALGRIPLLLILRALIPFWIVAIGFILTNAFLYNTSQVQSPTVLARWGAAWITLEGVRAGLSLGLRALALVSYSMLFVMTTDPTNFVLSLIQQARLSYRFGYGILVSYRFLPMLRAEYDIIRAAHHVRGIGERAGLRDRYEQFKRYAIPLLASAIRRSERVALAMDSKAFGAPGRSYYRVLSVKRSDWLFLLAIITAAALILIVLARAGLLQGFGLVPA
jgi:energy-coupling factor transport system permease protein